MRQMSLSLLNSGSFRFYEGGGVRPLITTPMDQGQGRTLVARRVPEQSGGAELLIQNVFLSYPLMMSARSRRVRIRRGLATSAGTSEVSAGGS